MEVMKSIGQNMNTTIKWVLRKLASPYRDQKMLLKEFGVETIFDVGANIGQTADRYGALFPEATIYSFEPFPEAFQTMQDRLKHKPQVKSFQCALADRVGQVQFYVNEFSGHNSLLPAAEVARPMIKQVDVIDVPSTTIDRFCEEHSIDRIDIFKTDTQGGELAVLQGAKGMLDRKAILVIFVEILFVPVYEGQCYFHEIYSFLSGFGYNLFNIYDIRYVPSGQIKWADAIFISPQMQEAFPPAFPYWNPAFLQIEYLVERLRDRRFGQNP